MVNQLKENEQAQVTLSLNLRQTKEYENTYIPRYQGRVDNY